ncbi:MAG: yceI [Mucilaginibacter sp.]|nr:yceI [Mucilaginibacter sp.]
MKNLKLKIACLSVIIALITSGLIPQPLLAQNTYRLSPGKDAAITVLGSSNVHDWTMTASTMESRGEFNFEGGTLRSLLAFNFSVDAKSLKSDHESMDTRTYKTIKADQYPKITYKLTHAVITAMQKNKYSIRTTGELRIAGATQTIVILVSAVVNPDNSISCSGSQKIKLTDFNIDPPSFMLGAMKVKNDLTIQFNLIYKNNQLLTQTN